MPGVGGLRSLTSQFRMRLYKPVYSGLPACRGCSDEEVERLTRVVYRRKPRLIIFPVVVFILFLISMLLPRPLSRWTGISMIWTLSVVGLAFGVPIVIYEQRVHRPAVNTEMERILVEQGGTPTQPRAAAKPTLR
jgi:hypothetical protein